MKLMPHRTLVLSMMTCGVLALPAAAGDQHRHSRADGEIDKLDCDVFLTRTGWEVEVRFAVDVEDGRFDAQYELNLRFTDAREPVRDEDGRPLVVRVLLDQPSKYHDDQVSFRRRVAVRLPRAAIGYPGKVRVFGELVQCSSGRVLDTEDEGAHFRRTTRR